MGNEEDTRARVLDVALRLFAVNSTAGTSLQMIADELGITKAALFHHFRSRDELVAALIEPALIDMRAAVEHAAAQRTPPARAEAMLSGFVDLAVRHRKLTVIISSDQAIIRVLAARAEFDGLVHQPIAFLGGTQPDPAGRINATLVLAGIGASVGSDLLSDLDGDALRTHLLDSARRILGLRKPRAK